MKDYVSLWDRLRQRRVAIDRSTKPVFTESAPTLAEPRFDFEAWDEAMRQVAMSSTIQASWSIPRPVVFSTERERERMEKLISMDELMGKDLPFYDYPKPRPPHRVQVTREWMEVQELLVREFYPHHQFVWRVAGDPKNWRQPPSKAQSTGWGNMPPPQSDKVVPHEFAAEGIRDMGDMTDRWNFNWVCASLQHQFHGWWQTSVLQSNITLYLLAVEAGDMVVYAKQCCVHRAEVVTAFTTYQGY